jgi:hypothetical protein
MSGRKILSLVVYREVTEQRVVHGYNDDGVMTPGPHMHEEGTDSIDESNEWHHKMPCIEDVGIHQRIYRVGKA